jgi:hypothetical protein
MSLILLIPNSIHAQSDVNITFDEQTCMSIILSHQVQSMAYYPELLELSMINSNMETLPEGVSSACAFAFESDDGAFYLSIALATWDSDSISQSKYAEILSTSQQSGYPITEGNNASWVYHLIEFNDLGLGSAVFSIKDNMQIGVNAPTVEFLIEPSSLVNIAKTIQTKIDNAEKDPYGFTNQHGMSLVETETLPPLKQFKNGTPYIEIKCTNGLELIQKYDGTPVCVTPETVFELINRGWVSDIILAVQSRIITLDPEDIASSYMDKITPTLDDFKKILSEQFDIDTIFSKFGEPHYDIGSGIHVYVYDLNDGTQMLIGYNGDILYVTNLDLDGNVLEELFVKN